MPEIKVRIFDEELTFDLDEEFATTDVPKSIAEFSLYLAEAKYQQRKLEAEYQVEKSKFVAALLSKSKSSGMTEWKIRNRFERSSASIAFKEGLALAERTINRLVAIVEGLKAKAAYFH